MCLPRALRQQLAAAVSSLPAPTQCTNQMDDITSVTTTDRLRSPQRKPSLLRGAEAFFHVRIKRAEQLQQRAGQQPTS